MENEKASYFEKTKITSAGLRLIHKLIVLGEPLVIKKAVIGDGISEQDPVAMMELVHEIPSRQTGQDGSSAIVDLQMYLPEDEQTILTRVRTQNGDTEFIWHELGLIANDPDEGEILFAYTRDNTESAMTFPVFNGVPISATVDISFFVHNAANVEINVTLPAEVSLAEFNAHKNAEELDHPDKSVKKRHIADYAVGTMQIDKGAVNNVRIGNNAVDARTIKDGEITKAKLSEDMQNRFNKLLGEKVSPNKEYGGSNIYLIPPSDIQNMPTDYCIFVFVRDSYDYGSGDSNLELYTYDLETGIRYWATQDSYFNISEITKSNWHAFR